MATSTPVALGLGGLAAVFILSGIQDKSLSEIFKGDFTHSASSGETGSSESAPAVVGKTDAGSRQRILAAAAGQLGVKYLWGGESEKNGFDCSGLTQWAYAQGGVKIPRTAQEQYNFTKRVSHPVPADLVFFGSSAKDVSHVGLIISPGVMEDAPHTGAVVRYEPFPPIIGASWGADKVIGYGQA